MNRTRSLALAFFLLGLLFTVPALAQGRSGERGGPPESPPGRSGSAPGRVASVPELDGTVAASAAILLGGGALVLFGRRRAAR